jgi:hypothetical protein
MRSKCGMRSGEWFGVWKCGMNEECEVESKCAIPEMSEEWDAKSQWAIRE